MNALGKQPGNDFTAIILAKILPRKTQQIIVHVAWKSGDRKYGFD